MVACGMVGMSCLLTRVLGARVPGRVQNGSVGEP